MIHDRQSFGWQALIGWGLLFALALGLRVYGLRYGLPHVYNPDEVAISGVAAGSTVALVDVEKEGQKK